MSTRAVIPPLMVEPLPEKQSYEMLESRLKAAEDDTRQLIDHLGSMGFEPPLQEKSANSYQPVSPFRGQVNDSNYEKFKSNYEALVSRVCKNESVLQSLKLNLVNLHGDKNFKQKNDSEHIKEKFNNAREAYEQEIGKLARHIEYLKEELNSEQNAKDKAREEIRELQKALGQATETRMEVAMTAEGLNISQTKLQKRITELKEEVSREQSLRASLEESHNTLLTRIREMESVVETERSGVKNMTSEYSHMKIESEMLREQVKDECHKKQIAESSYKMLCDEKENLLMKYTCMDKERGQLISEVSRLREQYEEIIKQMEQTQSIIDQQQNKNKELVEENENLTQTLRTTAAEHDKINAQLKKELEIERKKAVDKEVVEDEALRLKDSVAEITQENIDLKKKMKRAEEEISKLRTKISTKDEEFTATADGLEKELVSLREQLQILQKDKDKTMKDKEALLEEVNSTVDTMSAERSKLQNTIQQQQLELDSHSRARRKLEHENAHLLERVSGFEQQQQAQKHVENTLKEMMDQKNKMAYDNGRLQTQVEQANLELENLRKADLEVTKYRQVSEALASKYSQCETEISELKITIQRLESQLKHSQSQLDTRHSDYSTVSVAKEELLKDNQRLLTKLQSVEEREKRKIRSLQKNNDDAKTVNKEIASTLESVMTSHSQLQSVVESLQIELGKKDSQISRLKNEKNKEQQEWKVEMRRFEERMETMREDLRQERDKSQRKTTKDIAEIKKQNDNLSMRNMDLLKSNTELRQKTRDQEGLIQELKDKVTEHKRKMEYFRRGKHDVEEHVRKMKEMKCDIEELESLRDTYIAKNQEQAEMISTFMAQINSLQTELRQLAHAQSQTQDLMSQKERSLEKERKLKDELRRKYKHSKKKEDELDQMKTSAEKRLNEVREESLEISNHLKSAHEWFKDKFDNLQQELTTSRKVQEKLTVENYDQKKKLDIERKKAQAAAEKAREMIKASRQTISRLSDYADIADHETKEQLNQLYSQLQQEKDHSKFVEIKHQRYKDASARQFEQFLHETEDSFS
ncbi:hypothetical protein ACF0H5_019565 [Mactra antiquata]